MGIIIYFIVTTLICFIKSDELKQVLVLSRHNLRTPLEEVNDYTPRKWLKWEEDPGYLTARGAMFEEHIGEYFVDWLVKEKLLTSACPNDSTVHIYANSPQRTRMSAKHFARAFKTCNLTVHYKDRDAVFYPTNVSESFGITARAEMQQKLRKLNDLNFKVLYAKLNKILDIKNSKVCKSFGICDLVKARDTIVPGYNMVPTVVGPLRIGSYVADAFLMAYYHGEDLKNIAWGEIEEDDWEEFMKLIVQIQNVSSRGTETSKYFAKRLIEYVRDDFLQEKHKFTLVVGHDLNINSVLKAIGVKPYKLENQYELSPIGGKVVFEKWFDGVDSYLKINFVYMSLTQMRNGVKISAENPPMIKSLQLKDCVVNKQGFCSFKDFMRILDTVL